MEEGFNAAAASALLTAFTLHDCAQGFRATGVWPSDQLGCGVLQDRQRARFRLIALAVDEPHERFDALGIVVFVTSLDEAILDSPYNTKSSGQHLAG
jgi:hypothetical protein